MHDVFARLDRGADLLNVTREVQTDYGNGRIELAEAYWRTATAQTYGVCKGFGLHWPEVARRLSGETRNPSNVVLPSLLCALYTDRMCALDPVFAAEKAGPIRLESVQASLMNAWGYGKAVYDIDPDVATSIFGTELHSIPDTVLQYMPHDAVFISTRVNDCIGAFFHRFVLGVNGQVGLSFLLVKQGWPNPGDIPDFTCGTVDMDTPDKPLEHVISAHDASATDPDTFSRYVNLLVLLCCRNVEIRGRTTNTPGPSLDKRTQLPLVTPGPRHWDVGVREGAALRASLAAAEAATASRESGVRGPIRAHVRRAHWHSFHRKDQETGERTLVVHWLAPIFVGAMDDCVETHHKVGAP